MTTAQGSEAGLSLIEVLGRVRDPRTTQIIERPWVFACSVVPDRRPLLLPRITSNQMLLNFGRTRSPGRSSREIGDSWTLSSEGPAAMHRWTWFGRTPSGALRLIDTLVGSPNSRYVKSFVEYSSAALLRPVLPAQVANAICDDEPRSDVRIVQAPRHHSTRQRGAAARAGTVENRSYEKSVGMHRPRQLGILPQLTRDGTIHRQSCHKEHPMFRVSAPPKPQTPGPSRPAAPAPHEGRPG